MTDSNPPSSNNAVFISYAHDDDIKPSIDKEACGWVTFFWNVLFDILIENGDKHAGLWIDHNQIKPASPFTPEIEKALEQARLFIAVFSKNWIQSEWCKKEFQFFYDKHSDASDRLIPVYKHLLEREALPKAIQGHEARIGFQFFEIDDKTKHANYFYFQGQIEKQRYLSVIQEIAELIANKLDDAQLSSSTTPITLPEKTVYIALAASDLREERQFLVNNLEKMGIDVVPKNEAPLQAEAFGKVVIDDLSKASLAVHLLGENDGITLEGGTEPIVRQQLHLARNTLLPRILWAPRWHGTEPGSSNQRNPIDVVTHRVGELQANEEVYGRGVTDLSQFLRERLKPASVTSVAEEKPFHQILVAVVHPDDTEPATQLARCFQGHGFLIQLCLSDTEFPSGLGHTTIIIPWGNASECDLLTLLSRRLPATQIICLLLPGGDETVKNKFFHKNVITEKITLPRNRQEGRQLLQLLEILTQNGGAS